MNKQPEIGFTKIAWAVPIRQQTHTRLVSPMVFYKDFPEPPITDAIYTYMDEKGNIVPCPGNNDLVLPAYCYVQYLSELPPPPPAGYQYIWSELQRDILSPAFHFYHEIGTPIYGVDIPDLTGFAPFATTLLERSGIKSGLVENPDGYFSTELGVLITNYTIKPHRILRIYDTQGLVKEKLEYTVIVQDRTMMPHATFDLDNLEKLPGFIRDKVPGCVNNINVSKVDQQIDFHIRGTLLKLARTDMYCNSGWHKINGSWLYVQDNANLGRNDVEFNTAFSIANNPSLSARSAMSSAMGMLAICNQIPIIVPLVLFAHLGVLYSLFEHAGFPPRTILFVNGKTGSLKTALCSVLYNLTGDAKNNIPASFRDSVASIEAKFPEYADKVLLLDDFSPATTARSSVEMSKLLEDIIRYYGDGKGRGRSNATVTKSVTSVPRGLCCITGEDTGGTQSSLLRCLLIDVSNGIFDGERLAPYQNDPSLWTTHFNYFLEYASNHFETLATDIRNSFPIMRSELKNELGAGRIIDSAVCLCLTAKILLDYGVSIGYLRESAATQTLSFWKSAIIQALEESEDASTELDPVRFYISTLFEAVDSGSEVIAPDKDVFLTDPSVLGYNQNGLWHIWPDKLYALVTKRSQLQRKRYPHSLQKTHAALSNANLIKVTEEKHKDKIQRSYLHRESFGERPRMLVLYKDAAQQYIEK